MVSKKSENNPRRLLEFPGSGFERTPHWWDEVHSKLRAGLVPGD
jgi:hypothetical protein